MKILRRLNIVVAIIVLFIVVLYLLNVDLPRWLMPNFVLLQLFLVFLEQFLRRRSASN